MKNVKNLSSSDITNMKDNKSCPVCINYDITFNQMKLLMKYTMISIMLLAIFGGTFITSFFLTMYSFYNSIISFIFGVIYLLLFYEVINKIVMLSAKIFNYFILIIRLLFFFSIGELIITFSSKKYKKKFYSFDINDENSFENFFFLYESTYVIFKSFVLLCFFIKLNKYKKTKLIL